MYQTQEDLCDEEQAAKCISALVNSVNYMKSALIFDTFLLIEIVYKDFK